VSSGQEDDLWKTISDGQESRPETTEEEARKDASACIPTIDKRR